MASERFNSRWWNTRVSMALNLTAATIRVSSVHRGDQCRVLLEVVSFAVAAATVTLTSEDTGGQVTQIFLYTVGGDANPGGLADLFGNRISPHALAQMILRDPNY